MRIAIFSFYNGEVNRGVEVWVRELSVELNKQGHEITVYSNRKDENKNYKNYYSGIKIDWNKKDSTGSLSRKLFFDYWSMIIARSTIKLLKKYLSSKYDVVIPTNGGWQVAIIRIVSYLKKEKMVVVGHSGSGWDERNNLWAFPNLFIAISKEAEIWAKRAMPFIKTSVINNGINLDKFTEKGEKIKLELEKPIYLGVGAFEIGKRQELLIMAVSKTAKGSLVLIGDGSRKEELCKLGEAKLGKRIKILKVNHDQIAQYYRAADVFSLPVWEREAFGLVFLEAMACGLPVVTNNDPTRKLIVGEAGIMVDPTDDDKYADALNLAGKLDWGDKPRRQAEKFKWTIIADKYNKVLNDLIK